MAWSKNSRRRSELPPDWPAIRAQVLGRDRGECQHPLTFGGKCGRPANEVDHRDDPSDHSLENLQALCHEHHAVKTHAQSRAAVIPSPARRRAAEAHPGALAKTKSKRRTR